MLLINLTSCVYCGRSADAKDHIWPRSLIPNSLLVPACWQCNSIARNRWFDTFEEKAQWLLTKALRTNRARLEILNLTAPLVVEALDRHGLGRNIAPLTAAYRLSGFAGSRRAKLLRCTITQK